jgi:hypothetical protein
MAHIHWAYPSVFTENAETVGLASLVHDGFALLIAALLRRRGATDSFIDASK